MSATASAVFAGISNENEFFSHHYLAELFQGDIKETVKRWNEAEAADSERTAPHKRLWALRNTHTRLLRRAQKARDPRNPAHSPAGMAPRASERAWLRLVLRQLSTRGRQ